jgi:hypothetical protein
MNTKKDLPEVIQLEILKMTRPKLSVEDKYKYVVREFEKCIDQVIHKFVKDWSDKYEPRLHYTEQQVFFLIGHCNHDQFLSYFNILFEREYGYFKRGFFKQQLSMRC